jgi:hypothetical protein
MLAAAKELATIATALRALALGAFSADGMGFFGSLLGCAGS